MTTILSRLPRTREASRRLAEPPDYAAAWRAGYFRRKRGHAEAAPATWPPDFQDGWDVGQDDAAAELDELTKEGCR